MISITQKHVGRRGIFKAKRTLKEGVVQELSPSGALFRINGSEWLENRPEVVVELLPDRPYPESDDGKGKKKRHQPSFGGKRK